MQRDTLSFSSLALALLAPQVYYGKYFGESTELNLSEQLQDIAVREVSGFLRGVKIDLVGGGGIAATELPRLARELRRHGALVRFCVTPMCLQFIGLESLRWASQNEVVVNPTGLAEHICTADALVVCPATADLLSKAASGICCDGATTLLQSALGMQKTVIFCPTMHASLAQSPFVVENKKRLQEIEEVFFLDPRREEDKEKLANPVDLALQVAHLVNRRRHAARREGFLVVTLGGSRVMLDPVRCLTNLSTGQLGIELCKTLYALGFSVRPFIARTEVAFPAFLAPQAEFLPDYEDMYQRLQRFDFSSVRGVFHLLAASDFVPVQVQSEKISSDRENLALRLKRAKKLIDLPNLQEVPFRFAAKLTTTDEAQGVLRAEKMLVEKNLHAVFWNSARGAWAGKQHSGVLLVRQDNDVVRNIPLSGDKRLLAQGIARFFCGEQG